MSRQAVCGMYKRASEKINRESEIVVLNSDIINYHVLGYDVAYIRDKVAILVGDITTSEIRNIINSNDDFVSEVLNKKVNTVSSMLIDGCSMQDIIVALKFKEIQPTDIMLNTIIELAVEKIINNKCTDILARAFSITENREIIKDTIDKFNLNISFKDISRVLNS